MAEENKKTWIKQGNVDATFPKVEGLNLTIQSHSYCTTNNIIDNSGIFAIVSTKDGKPWDGFSNNNILNSPQFTKMREKLHTLSAHISFVALLLYHVDDIEFIDKIVSED